MNRKRKILFGLLPMLGCLIITACSTSYVADASYESYRFDSDMTEVKVDANADDLIKPYRDQMSAKMDVVLAENEKKLTRGKPESTLGNLLSDLMVSEAATATGKSIDFAVQNYGGIRIPTLPAGPITLGKVYEIMPFDNMLVVLELPGTAVNEFCQHIARSGGWPTSKELTFVIDDGAAKQIKIKGVPLDQAKTYLVATNDYVANGGDYSDFLKPFKQIKPDLLVRDAIVNYMTTLGNDNKTIRSKKDGRIKIK